MKIELSTKFNIGQTVFFAENTSSREEIPCTHCGGNYREIVNGIEYTCPHCTGGRERRRIDRCEIKSGVITNIRLSINGVEKIPDYITGKKIDTNIKYSVTKNRTESVFDSDGDSRNMFEGELYATMREAADAVKTGVEIVNLKGNDY